MLYSHSSTYTCFSTAYVIFYIGMVLVLQLLLAIGVLYMQSIKLGLITVRYTSSIAVIFFTSTYHRGYVTVHSSSMPPIDLAIDILMGRRDTDSPYMNNNIFTLENYKNSLEDTCPIIPIEDIPRAS